MTFVELIKRAWKGDKSSAFVLDFHYHRFVFIPELKHIRFPDGYKYYRYPKFQIL